MGNKDDKELISYSRKGCFNTFFKRQASNRKKRGKDLTGNSQKKNMEMAKKLY